MRLGFGGITSGIKGAAAAVGITGLAFGIDTVVKSGVAWAAQQASIQGALRATGQQSAANTKLITDSADAMAEHGGAAASEQIQALNNLVSVHVKVGGAVKLVALANDIAVRRHVDLLQVTKALGLAEQGRTTGLGRLGIIMPKVTTAVDALKNSHLSARDAILAAEAAGTKFTATQRAQPSLTNQVTPAMLAQAKAADQAASQRQLYIELEQPTAGRRAPSPGPRRGSSATSTTSCRFLKETVSSNLLPVIVTAATELSDLAKAFSGLLAPVQETVIGLMAAGVILGPLATSLGWMKRMVDGARAALFATEAPAEGLGVAAGRPRCRSPGWAPPPGGPRPRSRASAPRRAPRRRSSACSRAACRARSRCWGSSRSPWAPSRWPSRRATTSAPPPPAPTTGSAGRGGLMEGSPPSSSRAATRWASPPSRRTRRPRTSSTTPSTPSSGSAGTRPACSTASACSRRAARSTPSTWPTADRSAPSRSRRG